MIILEKTMDNAIYTFETKLLSEENVGSIGEGKALADKVRAQVMEDYKYDSNIKTVEWYCAIIKAIIFPPFNAVVIPATNVVLDPIVSSIPDTMAQFIDIQQMFQDIINGIVDESIQTVVNGGRQD